MEIGWVVILVILGISILSLIMLGSVARVVSILSNEDIGVTAPTAVDDALEKEKCKRELLGYSPIIKDTIRDKDHFVKCFYMGPIETDPIPDDILKSLKGVK